MRISRHIPLVTLLAFGLLGIADLSHSQPNVENVQTAITANPYTSLTIPSLVVSGSNTGVGVCITEASGQSVSGCTWNTSEALTEIVSATDGGSTEASIWYLPEATATTANVVCSMTGSASGAILGTAIAFSGVAASLPTLSDTDFCSSCTVGTAVITTTVANTMLFTCARSSSSFMTWGPHGAGQDERSDFGNTAAPDEGSSTTTEVRAIAGEETLTSQASATVNINYAAIGIEPFVEPPVESTRRRVVPWGN